MVKLPTKDNYVEDYVNDYVEKFKDENDNFVLPWKVNMAGKKLSGLSFPSKSDEAATKSYVDEAIKNLAEGDALVSKEGVFLKENGHYRATASIDIDNNKIENLPEPREDSDAATKTYVDDVAKTLTLEEALVRENGGYNVANAYINMNFKNIKNIGEPGHISDAATKGYVDETAKALILGELRYLIAAHASYHGDLIKGEYQFIFGGSTNPTDKKHSLFNGFLVPTHGHIKKFVVKDTGLKFNLIKDQDLLNYVVAHVGLDTPIPLFTLILIRENEKPVDIGTLHFMFTEYKEIGVEGKVADIAKEYVFKSVNPPEDGKPIWVPVRPKDILNIRTELNSFNLSKYRTVSYDLNYKLDDFDTEFFMYHATILIELDPL